MQKICIIQWLNPLVEIPENEGNIEDLHANSNFRRIILYAAILGV